jgi:hypothetical protein
LELVNSEKVKYHSSFALENASKLEFKMSTFSSLKKLYYYALVKSLLMETQSVPLETVG